LHFSRYPQFCKSTQYLDCLVEKYEEYELKVHGLVQRVTLYEPNEDNIFTDRKVMMVVEHYKHREDHMRKRIVYNLEKKEVEEFDVGCTKLNGLSSLVRTSGSRLYKFHAGHRPDGMRTRSEKKLFIAETYENRDDRMISRTVVFKPLAEQDKNPFPLNVNGMDVYMAMLTEKFSRDKSKPPEEDVETRRHYMTHTRREVQMEFHLGDSSIVRKCLVYNLKSEQMLQVRHPMHKCPESKLPTKNQRLMQVADLTATEKRIFNEVMEREKAKEQLDQTLIDYADSPSLQKCLYDAAQEQVNEMGHDNDIMDDEDVVRQKIDYLAPFLTSFPNGLPRNRNQAMTARLECLQALKERLLQRATIIQAHLDREQEELKLRNTQFNRIQSEDPEERRAAEEEFKKHSEEIMFRLSILDARLKRHEKFAIKEYTNLDHSLSEDPRLRILREKSSSK